MSTTPRHEAVISALESAARDSDDVTAAFVGGSIGTGRADAAQLRIPHEIDPDEAECRAAVDAMLDSDG